jgi:hypothetical protein
MLEVAPHGVDKIYGFLSYAATTISTWLCVLAPFPVLHYGVLSLYTHFHSLRTPK